MKGENGLHRYFGVRGASQMPFTSHLIRHVYWPLMEQLKGNKTRRYMQELKQSQGLSPEQLQERQKQKLKKLLDYAVKNVPAYAPYRELLGDGEDVFVQLQKIPPLTKARFREENGQYLSKLADPAKLIANRTGGSTGEPTRFYLDRQTVEHYEAARWLGLSWHGIQIGDPSVMVWGSPIELNQQQSKTYLLKERFLKNRVMISAYELTEAKLDEYLRFIRAFKPAYFYGYASALHLLAELMQKRGVTLGIPLKAVVSTAESLHPHQREAISQAFQAPVVNEYGARDGGIIAYQCPAGQMHVFAENCYLEVVDVQTKRPVPPGEAGLVLVTDLNNYAMPRLRYQLGDIVQFSGKTCSCGNPFPVLEKIEGREDDMFLSTRGHYVHGHYFNHIVRNMESFRTFQLIQHEPARLSLKLVKHPEKYRQEEEAALLDGIRQALGEDVEIAVSYVEEIPPSSSGKFRYAIREFPIGSTAQQSASTPS
jgi:phenylacetate-CoA ligase